MQSGRLRSPKQGSRQAGDPGEGTVLFQCKSELGGRRSPVSQPRSGLAESESSLTQLCSLQAFSGLGGAPHSGEGPLLYSGYGCKWRSHPEHPRRHTQGNAEPGIWAARCPVDM